MGVVVEYMDFYNRLKDEPAARMDRKTRHKARQFTKLFQWRANGEIQAARGARMEYEAEYGKLYAKIPQDTNEPRV